MNIWLHNTTKNINWIVLLISMPTQSVKWVRNKKLLLFQHAYYKIPPAIRWYYRGRVFPRCGDTIGQIINFIF